MFVCFEQWCFSKVVKEEYNHIVFVKESFRGYDYSFRKSQKRIIVKYI